MTLDTDILKTLAYSDVFDYPLSLDELLQFLVVPIEKDELFNRLRGMNSVSEADGYYFIAGRDEIVSLRKRREMISQRAYRRARRYGRMLGKLPFVRMVALTGSLAMKNSDETGDYDYMLVASPGRVWTARIFALALNKFANIFGETLCPNLIVSEACLEWKDQTLYSAREMTQMALICGENVFGKLCAANLWVGQYFPNWRTSAVIGKDEKSPLLQKLFEHLLRGKVGDKFEAWEMNRKIGKFTKQDGFGIETNFNADICQGNFDHHGSWTMIKYQQRLEQLELAK